VCGFITLHLRAQTKHAKIYEFYFLFLAHCNGIKIFQVKSNRTSHGPEFLKLHQFIYIIELYHQKNGRCCETKFKKWPQTIRWVGGVGRRSVMPQMTHSDVVTHYELQLKKKINSPALFVNEIHMPIF